MYHNEGERRYSADPYAGQYPPPPPLRSEVSYAVEAQSNNYYPHPSVAQTQKPEAYIAPPLAYSGAPVSYATPSVAMSAPLPSQPNAATALPSFSASGDARTAVSAPVAAKTTTQEEYYDPQAVTLNDYRYEEHTQSYANEQTYPRHRQEAAYGTTYAGQQFYQEELETPLNSKTPIINSSEEPKVPVPSGGGGLRGFANRLKKNKAQRAEREANEKPEPVPELKPEPAPENEKASYRRKQPIPDEEESVGCAHYLCCYNPAITCCSVFGLIITLGFLAGGIALIVASNIVSNRCTNECSSDTPPGSCNLLCSKVLHDGLLYGGIAVAALAGIAILWKLVMWCCAGYSKRK